LTATGNTALGDLVQRGQAVRLDRAKNGVFAGILEVRAKAQLDEVVERRVSTKG
jgi:hypothetical protein